MKSIPQCKRVRNPMTKGGVISSGRMVQAGPNPPQNERVALHDTMFAYAGTLTTHFTDPASDTEALYAVVWEKVASPR